MTDKELIERAARAAGIRKPRHGLNKTPEHRAWVHMRQRCNNPNKREYKHYGGRGIRVCARWDSFHNFIADMGERPSRSHSLDRINVDGDYSPDNCRWATQQEQVENTRVVRMVTIDGKTQSISAWEREKGLSRGQVRSREVSGWSLYEAITTQSIKAQKIHKYVPQGYSRLKNGTFRVMLDGKYIKTLSSEAEAIELVAITRAAAAMAK